MNKRWEKCEEEYLLKKYLSQPVEITAKRLQRTESAVKHKAVKLGLRYRLDMLGTKAMARCFHANVSVIMRWIQKFGLPVKKIKCCGGNRYDIDIVEFWKWAYLHRDIIKWSGYELGSLPPEPEWVRMEKANYKQVNHRKRFTEDEKRKIRFLFSKGLNYRDVADEMGRSYYSINHLAKTIYRKCK